MSETKHTPGPWEWDDDIIFSGEPIDFRLHAPWLCANDGTTPVLRGEINCSDAANARLIASAPDLLSALQSVIAEYRDGYGLHCVDQVRAAIEKATGAA